MRRRTGDAEMSVGRCAEMRCGREPKTSQAIVNSGIFERLPQVIQLRIHVSIGDSAPRDHNDFRSGRSLRYRVRRGARMKLRKARVIDVTEWPAAFERICY